jgi:replication-associated recombination protein RarA
MQPIWSARTPDGRKADEVISMLQKCVRRGLEGDALYLVKQLYHGRKQKMFGCDIWRHLLVYSVEDVGLADVTMVSRILDLERAAKRVVSKDHNADLLMIVEAVMILCRTEKSRAVDNAIHWFDDKPNYVPPTMEELGSAANEDQPSPAEMDDAIDKHTTRGRHMGRGDEHFFTNGTKLENESDVAPFQAPSTLADADTGRDSERIHLLATDAV